MIFLSTIAENIIVIQIYVTLHGKCPNTGQKKTPYLDTFHTVLSFSFIFMLTSPRTTMFDVHVDTILKIKSLNFVSQSFLALSLKFGR